MQVKSEQQPVAQRVIIYLKDGDSQGNIALMVFLHLLPRSPCLDRE